MCIQDLRPFSVVNGIGFREVIKCAVELGSNYDSNIDVAEKLPSDIGQFRIMLIIL